MISVKKILKTCLLGFCAFLGIASFCNATSFEDKIQLVKTGHLMYHTGGNTANVVNLYDLGGNTSTYFGTFCIMFYNATSSSTSNSNTIKIGGAGGATSTINNTYMYYTDQQNNRVCLYINKRYFNVQGSTSSSWYFEGDYKIFKLNTFLSENIPVYSLFIADLSNGFNEYTIDEDINLTYDSSDIDLYNSSDFSFEFGVNSNNRISKSSVNQNYCTSNNLCPSCPSCQVCTGYSIKLYDVSDEENPTLEYSGIVANNWNIYYSGVNVEQGLLGNTKSFMFYDTAGNCPLMTRLECQSYYSLVPLENITQEYCITNNLCPTFDCPVNTGDLSWSNVYINNILHVGASNIFFNIPSEFDWDYRYTTGSLIVDIEGYNVDSDYIEGIVDIQKFTPNSDDFNNIISVLIPKLVPGFVIVLVLYFLFRFIKKLF